MKIYLASKSPRRQQLLRQIGIEFETIIADTDESKRQHETALNYVQRVAKEKAYSAKNQLLKNSLQHEDLALMPILAADTTVVLQDGTALGKPIHDADALQMLNALSGKWHRVYTAMAILVPMLAHNKEATSWRLLADVSTTKVFFKSLTELEKSEYIASKESIDKAGSYAIQGLAAKYITKIEGSYTGVVGLPLYELNNLLNQI